LSSCVDTSSYIPTDMHLRVAALDGKSGVVGGRGGLRRLSVMEMKVLAGLCELQVAGGGSARRRRRLFAQR